MPDDSPFPKLTIPPFSQATEVASFDAGGSVAHLLEDVGPGLRHGWSCPQGADELGTKTARLSRVTGVPEADERSGSSIDGLSGSTSSIPVSSRRTYYMPNASPTARLSRVTGLPEADGGSCSAVLLAI
uniref:Uncharacterized protein n=1 Tax=Mycena chlorophos TaxID=658473 RepID=A0ABQ0L8E7_MYCCL|nr:predicted protein [Mycena chlorophos]